MPELPYIDEHAVLIPASREVVWTALLAYVADGLGFGRRNPLAAVLGTEPRSGFAVAESVPGQRLELAGRHHFSRYRLAFALDDAAGGTRLRALSYGAFPGVHGAVYRALVIGSRAHVVATNQILRTIRRRTVDGLS